MGTSNQPRSVAVNNRRLSVFIGDSSVTLSGPRLWVNAVSLNFV